MSLDNSVMQKTQLVTFQSDNPLGFAAKWHIGVVIDVRQGSIADMGGVRPGWQILNVNTLPYSEALLDQVRESGKTFDILFAVDAVKDCCLEHWTGSTISCPWCGRAFEQAVHYVDRNDWKVGSKVSVYSESEDAWFSGSITGVTQDGLFIVEYTILFGCASSTRRKKLLPRDSPDLRAAVARQISGEPSSFAEFGESLPDRNQREMSLFAEFGEPSGPMSDLLDIRKRHLQSERSSFAEFNEPQKPESPI